MDERYRMPENLKYSKMFCIVDGRKYFDKSFKLLFRNRKTHLIIKAIKVERANNQQQQIHELLAESSGETLLHLAAKYGLFEVAQYLLSIGSEVNARSSNSGKTPLMYSTAYGHTDICELLLDCLPIHADIFATDYFGESALYTSVKSNIQSNHEMLTIFLDELQNLRVDERKFAYLLMMANCPLYYIVHLDNDKLTQILRQRGYVVPKSLSIKDKELLHDAVCLRNLENVKLVMEQMPNIDVNHRDGSQYTPLYYAVEYGDANGNVSIINYLLANGADINARCVDGTTPLFAIFGSRLSVEEIKYCTYFLLQHGADPQVLDRNEGTIIEYGLSAPSEVLHQRLLDPIMAHLALQEVLGLPIMDKLRQQIDHKVDLKFCYQSCLRCLVSMKSTQVSAEVSIYKLLTDSDKTVIEFLRDPLAAQTFIRMIVNVNPYYHYILRRRYTKAQNSLMREKRRDSVCRLSNPLPSEY